MNFIINIMILDLENGLEVKLVHVEYNCVRK